MTAPDTTPLPADLALISAAIDLFGRDGYAAVSTRALAGAAGANLASIKYYFGGKDELYRAAVLHVIERLTPGIDTALTGFARGRELAGDDRERQALLVRQVVAGLTHLFLASDDIPRFMPFVLREFFVPGPHFTLFYEALPRRLHELFTQLVAMVHGLDPSSEDAIVRAHALIGQIMIFHVGREILLRRTGWDGFTPARIELITGTVQDVMLAALHLPNAEVPS